MNNGIETNSKINQIDFHKYLPENSLKNKNRQRIDWNNLGLKKHKQGYFYQDLVAKNLLFEFVLIIWPSGTGSKAHDHGNCLSIKGN